MIECQVIDLVIITTIDVAARSIRVVDAEKARILFIGGYVITMRQKDRLENFALK